MKNKESRGIAKEFLPIRVLQLFSQLTLIPYNTEIKNFTNMVAKIDFVMPSKFTNILKAKYGAENRQKIKNSQSQLKICYF